MINQRETTTAEAIDAALLAQAGSDSEPPREPPPEDPLAFLGDLARALPRFATADELEKERLEKQRAREELAHRVRRSLPGFLGYPELEEPGGAKRAASDCAEAIAILEQRLLKLLEKPDEDESQRAARRELLRFAKTWKPEHGNVVVLGETGVGKSTSAAIVVLRLLLAGIEQGGEAWRFARGIYWIRADKLELAMNGHRRGHGTCRELALAMNATLLILDDIGWEEDPKKVWQVLCDRYDAPASRKVRSIVTSGSDLPDIGSRYSDASVRRMFLSEGKRARHFRVFPVKDRRKRDAEAQLRRDNAAAVPVPFNEQGERS